MENVKGKIKAKKCNRGLVREVSASGQGRFEARRGNQSRHPEKEYSRQREGHLYWLGQKLRQEAWGEEQ